MKCKIFHARKVTELEREVNEFLEVSDVYITLTQFSTVYGEDSMEHLMFHTLILFYFQRAEEGDPFEEEEEVAPDDTPQPPY